MQQEAKYIVRPDKAKGLRTAFHIGFNHAVVSLTLLPEDRDCVLEEVWFNFYLTCGTTDKVQQ